MIPRILPAVASPRPPSIPPEASTSISALRPSAHANGAQIGQRTRPRMPSTSAGIAPSARRCGAGGGSKP